jgi:fatty acyl-CoA reductase
MMQSQILDFYENKNVFITGGTGFLGKVLIEKLLRSTNAATLYILIRQNKNRDASNRLERMLNCEVSTPSLKIFSKYYLSQLFDELRKKRPDYKRRIIAIAGDSAKDNLDLAPEDQEELISKVNIVFHVAATVHFNENLKVAYEVNVQGTKRLLDLSKRFQHLKVLLILVEEFTTNLSSRLFMFLQRMPTGRTRSSMKAFANVPSTTNKWNLCCKSFQ